MNTYAEPAVEIRSVDMWKLLRRRWPVVLITAGVVFAAAWALSSRVKVQYQADAVLRVGELYEIATGRTRLVEPVPLVIERLKRRSFFDAALERLPDTLRRGVDPGSALRVDALASKELASISVRAPSAEAVRRLMESVVAVLKDAHAQLEKEPDALLQKKKDNLSGSIESVRRGQAELRAALPNELDPTAATTSIARSIILTEAVRLSLRVDELTEKLTELDALASSGRRPTALFGPISVQDKPVSPSAKLILFIGAMLGISLGLFVALLVDYIGRRRSRSDVLSG